MELFVQVDQEHQVIHVMVTPVENRSCLHGDVYQPVRPGEYLMGSLLSYADLLALGNGAHVLADPVPAR